MTGEKLPDDVFTDVGYILNCLADCRDAIARLMGAAPHLRDNNALLSMDAATRILQAHDLDDDVAGDDAHDEALGPYGRCDTCGAPCDPGGCIRNRGHDVGIDPTRT